MRTGDLQGRSRDVGQRGGQAGEDGDSEHVSLVARGWDEDTRDSSRLPLSRDTEES
jgi:hypothetical protein